MKQITLQLICIFLPCLALADKIAHDELQYALISKYIKDQNDQDNLLGKSLIQLQKELNLSNVPWNLVVTKSGNTETRIYHFQGFYLRVELQLQRKDSKFTMGYGSYPDGNLDQAERYVTMSDCQIDGEKHVDVRLKTIRENELNGFRYTPKSKADTTK